MSKVIDQFLEQYSSEKQFEKRLMIVADIVNIFHDSDHKRVNNILETELDLCIKNKHLDGEALMRFMLSYSAFEVGNFKRGHDELHKVMAIFDEVKHHGIRARILNFVAFNHSHQGNFEKAFETVYECIRESELADDKKNEFWGVYTLGVFHFDLKDFSNSEKCYTDAANGFSKYGNKYGLARSETGLSSVYIQQGKFEEAEKLLLHSLAYYREMEAISGQSRSLNDLGVISRKTQKLEQALEYFKQGLQLRKETNHVQGIATSLNEIAETLLDLKRYDEAERYLREAQEVCQRINNQGKLYRTYFLFSQLYRNNNEPWKALEYYEMYDKVKTEVIGQAANNKIKELQTKAATEKADREKEIERLRNVELRSAYDIIEVKNKEITDSINYAKRIQYALLAHEDLLKENLPEHFVFFKPKDIVSGDFYWATKKDDKFYLAVCDSTGHGVPGAFMSLLNISFLNEAINEKNILQPHEVLNHVRQRLIENISQDGGQDGMDATLICFDRSENAITYSAANNSPVAIKNGELMVLMADKMPVGKGEKTQSFSLHSIDLQKGDSIYFFTDGYADQFGGPNGKKYMYKRFQEKLTAMNTQKLSEQKLFLEKEFNEWKGDYEQVDDVCVIGIKI